MAVAALHHDSMHALMLRYVEGDARAFDTLFRRLAPRIRRYLQRRIRAPELVDDLMQQTLLRVHVSKQCYDDRWEGEPGTVERWFLTSARRTMLDHFRSEYRRQARVEKVCQREDTEGFGRRDAPRTPEERLCDDEEVAQRRASVRRAVDALPANSREIVRRHKLEGEPIHRIANELSIPTVSLRVRAHRAYKKLAKTLGSQSETRERGA